MHRWPIRIALLAALAISTGCDSDDGGSVASRDPSLTVSISTRCVGTDPNILPLPTPDDFDSDGNPLQSVEMARVTVTGTDPGRTGGEIVPNAPVTLFIGNDQGNAGGEGGRFLSSNMATSRGVAFEGQRASDQFFCTKGGVHFLHSAIEDYDGTGQLVRTDPKRGFPVRCMPRNEWGCQCNPNDPTICSPSGPDVQMTEAGPTDGGPGGDAADAADVVDQGVPLLRIRFDHARPENLEIGIRGSFAENRGDNIELTFAVEMLSEPPVPLAGETVTFSLPPISPTGIRLEPESGITGGDGMVRVRLLAGGQTGVVSVIASVSRDDGTGEIQTEQVISPPIAIRGGVPSQRGFQFTCEAGNVVIPAFTTRIADDQGSPGGRWLLGQGFGANCTVQLVDRLGGRADQATQVFFKAEAGNVTQAQAAGADGTATTELRVGEPAPEDVEPFPYETANNLVEGPFNPRDGLVTLIASTRGEEEFIDVNGDGIYEAGLDIFEEEHDLPEPYVDANDNGQWDEGEDFRDLDLDGVWTDRNGQWDNSTEIWTSTRVLWVGRMELDGDPRRSYMDFECPNGSTCVCNDAVVGLEACGDNQPGRAALTGGCEDSPAQILINDTGSVAVTLRVADINFNCVDGRDKGTVKLGGDANLTVRPAALETVDLSPYCYLGAPEKPGTRPFGVAFTDGVQGGTFGAFGEITAEVKYENVSGGTDTYTFGYTVCGTF